MAVAGTFKTTVTYNGETQSSVFETSFAVGGTVLWEVERTVSTVSQKVFEIGVGGSGLAGVIPGINALLVQNQSTTSTVAIILIKIGAQVAMFAVGPGKHFILNSAQLDASVTGGATPVFVIADQINFWCSAGTANVRIVALG